MIQDMNRRAFLKQSIAAAGTLAVGAPASRAAVAPQGNEAALPVGNLAGLKVSRVILGGNLLTLYTHSRDLKYVRELAARYHTEAKMMETLALAEQHGINTISCSAPPRVFEMFNRYRARGGKMQWIVCLAAKIEEDMASFGEEARRLIGQGMESVYLHGAVADKLAAMNRPDLIAKALEHVKLQGVPAGVGAHDLKVIELCESAKVPTDYYIKTLHHHNYPTAPRPEQIKAPTAEVPGYWCADPDALIRRMRTVSKPWIAFKIMAAGAIPPQDAFPWAINNGADHILVGMFDFQLAEDVGIAREAFNNAKRSRPWRS